MPTSPTTRPRSHPNDPPAGEEPDDTSIRGRLQRVGDAARALAGAAGRSARQLPDTSVDALEDRVDKLVDRVIRHPSPVTTSTDLAEALKAVRSRHGGAASLATVLAGSGLARRTLGLGARRIPAIAAVTGTATALTVFASGFRELRMIASYLVHRARARNVEVHPARLRSLALQIYLKPDEPPRIEEPPRLLVARVASRWARSAAAGALPLVPDDIGRPSVRRWVSAADLVDVRLLAGGSDS